MVSVEPGLHGLDGHEAQFEGLVFSTHDGIPGADHPASFVPFSNQAHLVVVVVLMSYEDEVRRKVILVPGKGIDIDDLPHLCHDADAFLAHL